MKAKFLFGTVLLGAMLLTACASSEIKYVPQVKVLETIPAVSAPEWVKETKDFWEAKGYYYYRGMSEGMANLEPAKRAAEASARTSLAEQVKNTVRNEFSRALEAGSYDETMGGYLKDVFFSSVENITLTGVQIRESYLQRLLETGVNNTQRIYYRAYVLASISKADYEKLVKMAFTDTKAQVAANKSAKDLASETESRFWKYQEEQAK